MIGIDIAKVPARCACLSRYRPDDFVAAYNLVRRLKTLRGLTPYEFLCKCWASSPARFILNLLQQMPGRD